MQDSDKKKHIDEQRPPFEATAPPDTTVGHAVPEPGPADQIDSGGEDAGQLRDEPELSHLRVLRRDVARRLEAIVSKEAEVRGHVEKLNTRLQPLFQSFHQIETVRKIEHPDIVRILAEYREATDGKAEEISELQVAMVREMHFREQLAEAGLERWQSYRQMTADPAEAWRTRLAEMHQARHDSMTQLTTAVETLNQRWTPDTAGSGTPDVFTARIDGSIVPERAAEGATHQKTNRLSTKTATAKAAQTKTTKQSFKKTVERKATTKPEAGASDSPESSPSDSSDSGLVDVPLPEPGVSSSETFEE